jgi:N-acetylglucosamine kinase-like BadF-type ATPase
LRPKAALGYPWFLFGELERGACAHLASAKSPLSAVPSMTPSDLVLGIDGGGTKTVALLAPVGERAGETRCARGTAGPSNPRAVGFERAIAALEEAIDGAFRELGIERGRVAAACLGLAGAGRESERRELARWAESRRLAAQFAQVHDALPVLAAGAADLCGVALIAGTGSLAFGRNHAGVTARCGGWGYLLGDDGSGYALGRDALRAVARAASGRGPPTMLTNLVLERLRLSQPEELIETVYQPGFDRPAVAALAELVLEAARQGDLVATGLLDRAAGCLTDMIAIVAEDLGMDEAGFPLALTGGLLLAGQDVLGPRIATSLQNWPAVVLSWTYVSEPAQGAVRLARLAVERNSFRYLDAECKGTE